MKVRQTFRYLRGMQRLELLPGDVLVVEYAKHTDMQTVSQITGYLEKCFPGNRALVVEEGKLTFGVIGVHDIAKWEDPT